MSHRAEDTYEYVATRPLKVNGIIGYMPGDPVPETVVKAHEFAEDGGAVRRDEWDRRPADEPERVMVRGEMPPHLQTKSETKDEPKPPGKTTSRSTGSKAGD
jgi:hypothetical protein